MFLSVGYRLTMFFTPIPVVWLIRITCPTVFDLILEANYNDSVNFFTANTAVRGNFLQ